MAARHVSRPEFMRIRAIAVLSLATQSTATLIAGIPPYPLRILPLPPTT